MHGTGNYAILWVCIDCMLMHANGETSNALEEPEREPWGLLNDGEHPSMGLYSEDHSDACTPADREGDGCSCETDTFSTSRCDGCGSTLHGERHAFTLDYDLPVNHTAS